MKKSKIMLVLGMVFILFLSACSDKDANGSNEEKKDKTVALKVWVSKDGVEFTNGLIEDFKKSNPDKKYEVEVVGMDSSKAQENVKKDPEVAADIFMLPHDQLGQLVESGAIYENTKYVDRIKNEEVETALQGASYKDSVYGYPYGVETMFVYYDKTKLTPEDVKTFESLTTKGKIGINLAEKGADYTVAPFFLANGSLLYGEKGEDPKGTTFNSPEGIQVLQWIADLKNNPNVVHASADTLSMLESGKIDAMISGPWSKNDVKKVLGDNMAVAPYPTVDFGKGPKQLKAFQGVRLFVVNATTKEPLDAMALADFLSNKESQLKRFENSGVVPTMKELQDADEVKKDPIASTISIMSQNNYSVVMPKIPEIGSFWNPINAVINDAYKGKLSSSEMQAKMDELVKDVSVKE